MTPSAYRRQTEAIERNTAAIPVICEDMKRWLAEREAASPLLPHDGGSHDR